MYTPSSFRVEDAAIVLDFIRQHDFATVVTNTPDHGLIATHLPVLVEEHGAEWRLIGHVARANPHGRAMDGTTESLVVFGGPHGYVSPRWYRAPRASVPTWNYSVVHAYGRLVAREDTAFLRSAVGALAKRFEGRDAEAWSPDWLEPSFMESQLRAIVGFEMRVDRFEAKFKLGQNRSREDRAGTVAGLEQLGTHEARDLAAFMRRHSLAE